MLPLMLMMIFGLINAYRPGFMCGNKHIFIIRTTNALNNNALRHIAVARDYKGFKAVL